jgi:hypothetical protein
MLDAGIFTVSCFAELALRILVNISAMESVTCITVFPPLQLLYQLAFLTPGI